jgi:hypothetical protein
MQVFILERSENPKKKYTIIRLIPSLKYISFGDSRYEDFTTHNDSERKKRYLARHKPTEDWNNSETAGFWSRWLLWNKKTISASIRDMEKRFEIKIAKAF